MGTPTPSTDFLGTSEAEKKRNVVELGIRGLPVHVAKAEDPNLANGQAVFLPFSPSPKDPLSSTDRRQGLRTVGRTPVPDSTEDSECFLSAVGSPKSPNPEESVESERSLEHLRGLPLGKASELDVGAEGIGFPRTGSTLGVDEEFRGPDTSSLAAFLFSFLSLTPQRPPASLSGSSSYSDVGSEELASEDEALEHEVGGEWEEGGEEVSTRGEGSSRLGGQGGLSSTLRHRGGKEETAVWSEGEDSMRWRHRHRRRHGTPAGEGGGDGSWGSEAPSPKRSNMERGAWIPGVPGAGAVRRWVLSRLGVNSEMSSASDDSGAHQHSNDFAHSTGVGYRAALETGAGGREEDPVWLRRGEGSVRATPLRGFRCDAVPGTPTEPAGHSIASVWNSPHQGPSRLPAPPATLATPSNWLPALSEESALLKDDVRTALMPVLPAIAQGREWVLLYSTKKHGISLNTLYRKSLALPGPSLVAVGERGGSTFGAFSSTPLQICSRRKYQGSSDSFVFSDISGRPEVFKATGANRYFMLCLPESLSFGGGGHFALCLEQDLLTGTSGPSETFDSPRLTTNEDFAIREVELWGFAHASKYTPNSTAWHETAPQTSLHTVL